MIWIETWVSSSQYWLLVSNLASLTINQSFIFIQYIIMHYAVHGDSGTDKQRISGVQRILSDDKWFVKFYQSIRDSINDLYDSFFTRLYPSLREFYQCFIWFYPKFLMLYHCFLTEKKYYLPLYLIFIVLRLWLPPGSWMLPGFPLVSGYTGFPFSVLPSGFPTLEREVPETKTMFITGKNVNI